MTQWFVLKDGDEVGPLTPSMLKALAEQGKIHPDTRIRKAGMQQAVPASRVAGLFDGSQRRETSAVAPVDPPADAAAPKSSARNWLRGLVQRSWKRTLDTAALLRDDARRWARGRSWLVRLPLLLFGPDEVPMLKILGPDVEYVHDFHYMFSELGVLSWSAEISYCVWVLAVISSLLFVVAGTWLLFHMVSDRGSAPRNERTLS